MMRRVTCFGGLWLALWAFFCASTASAGLLYEAFDYPAGNSLAGQGGWQYVGTGGANTAAPIIGTGSLSYPGLPASTGNSALTNRTQSGSARAALSQPVSSGSVYYSMVLRVNDLAGLTNTTTGSFLAGLHTGVGTGMSLTTGGAGLLIHRDLDNASAYNLGIGVSVNNADRVFDTTELASGQTVFVVAEYRFNPTADDDLARLWINPPSATWGAAVAPPATTISDGLLSPTFASDTTAALASFFLRNNSVEPQQIQIDDIRVGQDWAAVTPEPSAMVLAAFGVVVLLAGYRRRAARS